MAEQNTITVLNEFGKPVELELVDALKVGENKYVIVSEKDSDVANAYKEVRKNGEVEYASIGSGAEFKNVLQIYNEKHNH
ncbi:DUF1292 domain-containing protein [Clostridium aestuarii]|uniref:DUF1292 domain-containing protein n=1 Tax=Clostridium aestuarii TaxID=338193 RepID=A0ABT4CWI8_9CLOT|nr:DUF1292 domain-containing protein [Clostridium aestuarii]MCY6483348.1 DUF1292 domain-containing protein [Clostridium aestuarii]